MTRRGRLIRSLRDTYQSVQNLGAKGPSRGFGRSGRRVQQVGVDHRRAHVGVAEKLLDRADVVAGFQQVRGEAATLAFCIAPVTWVDAELDCIAQDGHLLSIHDTQAQDLVVSSAVAVQPSSFWTGLTEAASDGDVEWADCAPYDDES